MKTLIRTGMFTGIVLLLAACGPSTPEITPETHPPEEENIVGLTREQYATAGIRLGNIEMKSLSGTIRVNGVLDVPPQNLVSISSPFGGTVKSTALLQGMKVRKGQVVAMIQNPEFIGVQQDYLDFSSQLEYLKLEYERQQELAQSNINAKKTLQKAKSDYESMRARVSGLKARLELMNISPASLGRGTIRTALPLYSPISGYVTKVNTNIGAYVTPSDVLFNIAGTEHLHAELTVFEKDVPKLKVGQKVRFTLANEDHERMATVYLIGREISADRTVNIHCHLDKEDKELLPGMYLNALVESGSHTVEALPEQSVVSFEGQDYVFAEIASKHKSGRHFEMIPVKTGARELGYVEIAVTSGEGLKHRKIVVNGAYDLLSKLKNSEEEE